MSKSPSSIKPSISEPALDAPTHEQIAKRAYERWVESGRPAGQAHLHWSKAEQELRHGPKTAQ